MKKFLSFGPMLILLLISVSCGKKEGAVQNTAPTYVKVEKVVANDGNDKLIFNGHIKEKSLTSLSFRVGGPLVSLTKEPGDYVTAGETIAQIDKRDYELQVASTKSQYEQLEGEFERYQELHEKGKIPANAYEKIKSGYEMARTAYNNAVNQLNDTQLKAPISGYIYEKLSENHQTVGAGQPIVSIINLAKLEIVISVPENQLNSVKNAKEGYINVKNAHTQNLLVKQLSVGEKTLQDGLYQVKYELQNNPEYGIAPGMTAELTLYKSNGEMKTSIPSSSLFYDQQKTYVWIYNSGSQTIQKQEIKVNNILSDGRIEVLSGIKQGDQIITAGVHHLSEGQKVEPIHKPGKSNIGGLL